MPDQRAAGIAGKLLLGRARLARDIPGAFKPDQYWNMENTRAHERTTGPEIWEQTDGRLTHFVASVGTGGTISGAVHFLRAKKPDLVVVGADPEGSVLSGDTARPYLTEGVGEDLHAGHVRPGDGGSLGSGVGPRRLRHGSPDHARGGILAGESCGTAMIATLDLVRELAATDGGHEAVIVTLLPDGGRNYLSKLYNDEWMRANGLLPTPGAVVRISELLRDRHRDLEIPDVVIARTTDRVGAAIDLLQLYGISQLPVSEQPEGDELTSRVGQRARPALLGVPGSVGGCADHRRGHGSAAADARRRDDTRRRVRDPCPTAPTRCLRCAANGRREWSPSSTCSSTSRIGPRRPLSERG